MKIKLSCTYYNEKKEKVGDPGTILESPRDATAERLKSLVEMGSAELVEPPKKSERD